MFRIFFFYYQSLLCLQLNSLPLPQTSFMKVTYPSSQYPKRKRGSVYLGVLQGKLTVWLQSYPFLCHFLWPVKWSAMVVRPWYITISQVMKVRHCDFFIISFSRLGLKKDNYPKKVGTPISSKFRKDKNGMGR